MLTKLKYYILFILIALNFSCYNKSNSETYKLEKNYGMLYFIKGTLDSATLVECDNFLQRLHSYIYYIELKDIESKERILKLLDFDNTSERESSPSIIDVRYRLELDKDVICIDERGYYSINGLYKGKLNNFDKFLAFLINNRDGMLLDKYSILKIKN